MPSTVIRDCRYDPESRQLRIVFQTGRRYVYYDVPPDIYFALRSARSRGAYFNVQVRDKYPYSRLDVGVWPE